MSSALFSLVLSSLVLSLVSYFVSCLLPLVFCLSHTETREGKKQREEKEDEEEEEEDNFFKNRHRRTQNWQEYPELYENTSEDSLWALPRLSSEAFGDSLGGPGASREVKVGSQRGLEGLLGVSWAVLGGSWEALGRAWEDLGGDTGKSPKNE